LPATVVSLPISSLVSFIVLIASDVSGSKVSSKPTTSVARSAILNNPSPMLNAVCPIPLPTPLGIAIRGLSDSGSGAGCG